MCKCVQRCQSVGGFADSLARKNRHTHTHEYVPVATQPDVIWLRFPVGRTILCHLLALFHVYIIILMFGTTTNILTFSYTNSLDEVNERSFADKNGWFLIIKSYIKRIGLAIMLKRVNNHFIGKKGLQRICRHFLSMGKTIMRYHWCTAFGVQAQVHQMQHATFYAISYFCSKPRNF